MTGVPLEVLVRRVRGGGPGTLPEYRTDGASGMDLRADVDEVVVPPLGRTLVPTGIAVAIPEGLEGQVRPRSGLAASAGLTCLNSPGTIDSDYRGEILVLLVNLGEAPVTVRRGDRIAQLVFAPVVRAALRVVAELPATTRGDGGFGHTGT